MIEERGQLVAYEAVEDAPRLLRVHEVIVNLAGMFQRLLNGLLGNLVEFYAVFLVFVQTENGL